MRVSISPEQFWQLLLSHHPDYPCFKDDVIVLFNRRICAGCLLGYPTALAVLVLLRPSGYESVFFALVLALVSQLRSLSGNRIIRNLGRVVAGIAFGFGLGGGYWALVNGNWLAVAVLIAGAGMYLAVRILSVQRKLKNVIMSS